MALLLLMASKALWHHSCSWSYAVCGTISVSVQMLFVHYSCFLADDVSGTIPVTGQTLLVAPFLIFTPDAISDNT